MRWDGRGRSCAEASVRILYSHRIQSRDGMSVHVEEMVAALRAEGHEVLVIGPGFYEAAEFGGESGFVAWLRARLPGVIGEIAELAYNLPAYLRLRRACAGFAPDVIYERYNLYYLAGWLLARRRRLPFLLEVNAPLADERTRFATLRLRALAHRLEGMVWRGADRVFAVTSVLGGTIAAAGVDSADIVITPNGIDLDRFAALPARPAAPETVVLGFVGFIRSWHGLDRVIAAMAGDARVELRVVGDGPVLAELRAQAASLGIAERVTFTGLAARDAVPALVAGFDIALQPRVVDYASPLKIFEYMAAGRAIVAPDQPNIREILTDGRTALLFDPHSEGAMWQAIARLVEDPELRRRLGEAAREEITLRDYTWRGNARRVVDAASAIA